MISILLFSWLSIFCQHCMALAEPDQSTATVSHEHCIPQIDSETDLSLTCVSHCDDLSAIHDTKNKQQKDHKVYKQTILVSEFYPVNFKKVPELPILESPPDQATFLPLEHYTVQLK